MKMFNINPSYIYSDWENIVKQFKNESWTENYIKNTSDETILNPKSPTF